MQSIKWLLFRPDQKSLNSIYCLTQKMLHHNFNIDPGFFIEGVSDLSKLERDLLGLHTLLICS